MRKKIFSKISKVVIKVGTSIITDSASNKIDEAKIKLIVEEISSLISKGIKVILVSSGAIGAGMGILGLKQRPKTLSQLQAVASIGQNQLMKIYEHFFALSDIITAQILLTQEDFNDRLRYLNAKNTFETLINMSGKKIIPVVNENDAISSEEIKFGDNDRLSSLVADLIKADLLIILSDVEGLYAAPPSAEKKGQLITLVKEFTPDIEKCAAGTLKCTSIGGMKSKIEAAKVVTKLGIPMVIVHGSQKGILNRLFSAEEVGTLFLPQGQQKLKARKGWIAFTAKAKGKILVDQGAKNALILKGKSLLASGIIEKQGQFLKNDTISIADNKGKEFARGLTNFSSTEIEKIKGLKTNQIKEILGSKVYDEVIHRDNLVVL